VRILDYLGFTLRDMPYFRIEKEVKYLELLDYINKEISEAAWTKEYYPFKSLQALRAVVELQLGDDKYPTDIFPELTETDKENLKEVHRLFPNLIGRVDASACRRAFGIAEREVREAITKELG